MRRTGPPKISLPFCSSNFLVDLLKQDLPVKTPILYLVGDSRPSPSFFGIFTGFPLPPRDALMAPFSFELRPGLRSPRPPYLYILCLPTTTARRLPLPQRNVVYFSQAFPALLLPGFTLRLYDLVACPPPCLFFFFVSWGRLPLPRPAQP